MAGNDKPEDDIVAKFALAKDFGRPSPMPKPEATVASVIKEIEAISNEMAGLSKRFADRLGKLEDLRNGERQNLLDALRLRGD